MTAKRDLEKQAPASMAVEAGADNKGVGNPRILNDEPTPAQAAAENYVRAGWALVPIERGTKGPKSKGWNQRHNAITSLDQCERITEGVGLAHAYSRTCALDLDDLVKAKPWLYERGVDLDALLQDAEAVRISSGRPGRAKLLYRLPEGVEPLATKQLKDDGFELRCATADGLTVQDVLPPSIHPDTGEAYTWQCGMVGDWSSPPVLPPELLALWQGMLKPRENVEVSNKAPLGVGDLRIREVLTHYSPDAGYQDWLGVGMALHHESQGSDRGLDLWDEWSATGATYKGRDDLLQHWDSFGKRSGGALKTMAGLMATVPPSADEFEDLDETETSATYKPRFKILTGSEFIASQGPLRWLVKGLLPKADVGILFGESGAGKTFIVLDLVMAIARGVDSWRGHRVRKGRVLYIVAEGAAGFQNRLQAYARHHQVSPDLLNVIADAPNLLEPRTVADLLSDIKAVGVYDLVVVDTLAKTTPGANENASEDMGRALAHCARVSRDTGAMVLLIHHSGKDASRGARGWSGLKGAVDVELEVMRDGNDRALQATKQKDGAEGQQYGFRLLPVLLGLDEDGDDVTSCVVEHSDLAAVVRRKRPRNEVVGSNEKIILRTLETLAKASEGGKVMCTDLLHEAAKEIPRGDAKKDKRRDYAFAAFENLERKQRILVDGQWVAFPQDSPSVPV